MGVDPSQARADLEVRLDRALQHYGAEQLGEAETICVEILSETPQEPRALHLLGRVWARSGLIEAGLEKVQQAISLSPHEVDYLLTQGELQWQLQDPIALHAARQVTLQDPGHGRGYLLSAQIFFGQCRWLKCFAHAQLAERLLLDPVDRHQAQRLQTQVLARLGDPALTTILEQIHHQAQRHWQQAQTSEQLGQPDQAFGHYTWAIYTQPDLAAAEDALGTLLGGWGYPERAILHHKRALYFQPQILDYQLNLGIDYQKLGDLETAKLYFEQALGQDPEHLDAIVSLATVEDAMGDPQQALDRLGPWLHPDTITPDIAISYAGASRSSREKETAIDRLNQCLSNPQITRSDRRRLGFALGSVHDSLGHFDLAFAAYQQANGLYTPGPQYQPFDPEEHIDWIARIRSVYTASDLPTYAKAEQPSDLPVFIVGMPRSGTSLVEQILSTHPHVFGAGEREDMRRITRQISTQLDCSYPGFTPRLDPSLLTPIARDHIQTLRGLDAKALRITDKMPTNFLYLGLISLLLPNCRIIHCLRDPRDTCLSCYFHDFVGHPYSYDLGHLGTYYRQYRILMDHWKQVLDIPILEVHYEQLVKETEGVCRQILEFCQLDWDPVCLSFYRSNRVTKTASGKQVKQPIYTTSMSRYRHYQAHLDPLLEALSDRV